MEKTILKITLSELFADFYENGLPAMTPRQTEIPEVPHNATVILGMRRSGKTFLLFQRMNELLKTGISMDQILYINFEDDRLLGMTAEDLKYIPETYYQTYPDNRNKRCYFFFDEIQNVKNWEIFVRRMIDTPNVQIYLSGSSAKLLSSEIATAMRGRSVEIENLPLSFTEFLIHHKYFEKIPRIISSATRNKLQHAMENFFSTGGMPAVQNVSPAVRATMLQGYVNTVIYKDVAERHNIPNTQTLKYIMQLIFNNPARPISIRKASDFLKSQQIAVSREYVADYLDYLADAYLLHKIELFSDSVGKRKTNPAKYYLNDIGIIRAMRIKRSMDLGPLLENLVYLYLRSERYEIAYVLTSDNSEVDFIAHHPMQEDYILIQVCYDMSNQTTFEREVSALRDAADALSINKRYIITWDDEELLPGNIQVVPVWKFLLGKTEQA